MRQEMGHVEKGEVRVAIRSSEILAGAKIQHASR
jgi:hypothetical protein